MTANRAAGFWTRIISLVLTAIFFRVLCYDARSSELGHFSGNGVYIGGDHGAGGRPGGGGAAERLRRDACGFLAVPAVRVVLPEQPDVRSTRRLLQARERRLPDGRRLPLPSPLRSLSPRLPAQRHAARCPLLSLPALPRRQSRRRFVIALPPLLLPSVTSSLPLSCSLSGFLTRTR